MPASLSVPLSPLKFLLNLSQTMQTRDKHVQSLGICQKLFNLVAHNFLSRAIKRLTSASPHPENLSTQIPVDVHQPNPSLPNPDHNQIVQPNRNTINVHFKHGEDDDHLESWTRLDHVHFKEAKDETNPGQVKHKSEAGKPRKVTISDGKKDIKEDKKGKKKLTSNTANSLGEKLPLVIDPRDEEELDSLIVRPHLISVASNINEKSDEYIKTRIAAMQD